jgi:DNA repair exonuclease SbcCD ATPase subunit
MTAYELELVAMAKNRGDSLSRQLADTVKKQDEQIEALKQHWSEPQTDLIVLLREEVTLMQKYLEEQNLREHFVAWRQNDCK